ncbi:uncharacterized 19.3 kDa protein in dapB 3'region [Arthrobacter sp. Hiyo8]|nr:uncharacterized 19.3 kDa protein in dapB 3'region [Arthrobacter sp. Hiyo8]
MGSLWKAFKENRTKIWVGAVTLLLVLYLVVTFERSILLLSDANLVAKGIGAAYLVLPIIGAWALIRELVFGARTEKMAKVLEAEGGLPVDNLPRTPGGRIVRAAADAEFEKYRVKAEAAPRTGVPGSGSAAPTMPPATASARGNPCATPCDSSALSPPQRSGSGRPLGENTLYSNICSNTMAA